MRDWIIFFVLYVVGLALYRLLGNFGAAGDAFRRWGESRSSIRVNPGSSS
jgi:hypothetical protein